MQQPLITAEMLEEVPLPPRRDLYGVIGFYGDRWRCFEAEYWTPEQALAWMRQNRPRWTHLQAYRVPGTQPESP